MTSSAEHRQRGAISIADAATAAVRLGATSQDEVATILSLLGLITEPDPTTEAVLPPAVADSAPARTDDPFMQFAPDDAEETEAGSFAPLAGELRFAVTKPPAWLDAVPTLAASEHATASIPVPPPLDPALARASMVAVLSNHRPSRQVDVRRVVDQVARVQGRAIVPMLDGARTASFVQLLLDYGEGMEPYQHDLAFLTDRMLDVMGPDRCELHSFIGSPLRGIDPDPLTGEHHTWILPGRGSVVVVIGVLGRSDSAPPTEWRAVAEAVADRGARLVLLTPSAIAGDDLTRVALWDDLAELGRGHG